VLTAVGREGEIESALEELSRSYSTELRADALAFASRAANDLDFALRLQKQADVWKSRSSSATLADDVLRMKSS
jgi:hypothetical protein